MSYALKTDDEILQDIANKLDILRRSKKIKDCELASRGGNNRILFEKFRNGHGSVSLKTFVRFLRGLNELDRLESMLDFAKGYTPTEEHSKIPRKRVRDRKSKEFEFSWDEDK